MQNSVLIIDYGSQVTELIARKIRELNIYSELKNPDITLEEITHLSPKAIILSGGPYSVYEEGAPQIDQKIFDLGIPILGICYGQQLICHTLGGRVEKSSTREFGKAVSPVGTAPVRGRGINEPGGGIFRQCHRFPGNRVGQTEDYQVRAVDKLLFHPGILALVSGNLKQFDVLAPFDPVCYLQSSGAFLSVYEYLIHG